MADEDVQKEEDIQVLEDVQMQDDKYMRTAGVWYSRPIRERRCRTPTKPDNADRRHTVLWASLEGNQGNLLHAYPPFYSFLLLSLSRVPTSGAEHFESLKHCRKSTMIS